MSRTPERPVRLERWYRQRLAELGRVPTAAPVALTADASSRRFHRLPLTRGSSVLVDAPPETENNHQYVALAAWLRRHGLHAPEIFAADLDDGFFLVEDLGDATLGAAIAADPACAGRWYRTALDVLIRMQCAGLTAPPDVPGYDAPRFDRETALFDTWFAAGLLGREPPAGVTAATAAALTRTLVALPPVCVHLDWHSRNLLTLADGDVGIVDFQDARLGPAAYDVVSLLRDCYVRWPEQTIADWREYYRRSAAAAGIPGTADAAAFERAFDLCGIQRHLKCLGIFARLSLRDGRHGYLSDIPRILEHLAEVMPRHPETAELGGWLAAETPRIHTRLEERAA